MPPPGNDTVVTRYYEDALRDSRFLAIISSKQTVITRLSALLHNNVLKATPKNAPMLYAVDPWWFHAGVVESFRLSGERYRNQRRATQPGVVLKRDILVPTDEELLQGLKRLPTPMVAELHL